MTSPAERCVSQGLRDILEPLSTGAAIESSAAFLEVQSALEQLLPAELGWEHESFDAFRFVVARKVGGCEAELIGLALLISDQTWTPIYLRIRVGRVSAEISAIDCRVGEPGDGALGLFTLPYGSMRVDKFLHRLPDRIDSMEWIYRAVRP